MIGNKRSDPKSQVAFLPQEEIASSMEVRHGLESLCTPEMVSVLKVSLCWTWLGSVLVPTSL